MILRRLVLLNIIVFGYFSGFSQFINPSLDSTYKSKGLWASSLLLADKEVVFKKYATIDTTEFLSLDAFGRLLLRKVTTAPAPPARNDSTFFNLNNGNRTIYGRVNFNNTAYEWRGLSNYQILDSGRSVTNKIYYNVFQVSKGFYSNTQDSLFASSIKNSTLSGLELTYNSTSGAFVNNNLSFNKNGLVVDTLIKATVFNISALNIAPATATSPGTIGEIRYTSTHIYWCIAPNTWIRVVGTTF